MKRTEPTGPNDKSSASPNPKTNSAALKANMPSLRSGQKVSSRVPGRASITEKEKRGRERMGEKSSRVALSPPLFNVFHQKQCVKPAEKFPNLL